MRMVRRHTLEAYEAGRGSAEEEESVLHVELDVDARGVLKSAVQARRVPR